MASFEGRESTRISSRSMMVIVLVLLQSHSVMIMLEQHRACCALRLVCRRRVQCSGELELCAAAALAAVLAWQQLLQQCGATCAMLCCFRSNCCGLAVCSQGWVRSVLRERGVCRRVQRCASRGMEVQGRQQGCKGERKAT
jgi:hypothetical protein